MGGLLANDDEARDQALALARRTPLPITARSLTEAEVARIDGRYVPVVLGIYLAGAVPLFLLFAFAGNPGVPQLALLLAAEAALGLLLWLLARRRARRRADYRDPRIVVEIGEGGATVRSAGRDYALGYREASVTFTAVRLRGVRHFLGLVLASPLGPLRLDALWFRPGRTLAAALAGKLAEHGALPPLADREAAPTTLG